MIRPDSLVWVGKDWSDREEHVARHGLTRRDVEEAVDPPLFVRAVSRVRVGATGQNRGGRYITVILERLEMGLWMVVTARDADDPERREARNRRIP